MKEQILLVDDHPLVSQGLAQLIGLESDLAVCGQATNANAGLKLARSLDPDLVVADLSMVRSSGWDFIKDIRAFLPKLPVLIVSMHDESVYAERALRAGAQGYVMKSEPFERLLAAVRRVLGGGFFVSEAVQARSVQRLAGGFPPSAGSGRGKLDNLTNRELEVLTHLSHGKRTRIIAEELHLSVKTIESHQAHLKEKLDLADAPSLLLFAVEWGRHRHDPQT